MYSHLFHSLSYDNLSKETCYRQYHYFQQIKSELEKNELLIPLCHLCNTGGVINYPELAMDMIRVGSLLWDLKGVDPQVHQKWQPPLKPIFQLKSRVAMVRWVKKGESIGYSFGYVANKDMKVAIISCGYTDGYSRDNSNHGYVLIRGQRVQIIGNICMDMMIADVTKLEDVCMGDLVTIYGKDGQEEISCSEASYYANTIEPVITTIIGRRVPRLYYKNKKLIHVEDYLLHGEF